MGNTSFFMNLWGVRGDESQSKREPTSAERQRKSVAAQWDCTSEHPVWSGVPLDVGAHLVIHRSAGLGLRQTWVWILLYHQQVISLKTLLKYLWNGYNTVLEMLLQEENEAMCMNS